MIKLASYDYLNWHKHCVLSILAITLTSCAGVKNQQLPSKYVVATNINCKVYNPYPSSPSETVSWYGKCINNYATGKGKAVWADNGKTGFAIGTYKYGILQSGLLEASFYNGDYYKGMWESTGNGKGRRLGKTKYEKEHEEHNSYLNSCNHLYIGKKAHYRELRARQKKLQQFRDAQHNYAQADLGNRSANFARSLQLSLFGNPVNAPVARANRAVKNASTNFTILALDKKNGIARVRVEGKSYDVHKKSKDRYTITEQPSDINTILCQDLR